ncbi:hypothetical protein [Jiangella aurantiaca]|uniref:hypothetical protein n=1 Tax=Jiangella aurantiaca TaxID=2530373 RepID=UPI00193D10EE|nr:hypothetical protein [Jiangella aurantiaca]
MLRRDVGAGLVAAAAALLAMAGVAAAGLVLLDAGQAGDLGALMAAVVALAAGGPATLTATPPGDVPISLQAGVEVMPLGVTVVGAAVLGVLLLRRGRDGLGVRGAVATVVVAAGLLAVAQLASGTAKVRLPNDAPATASAPAMGGAVTGGADGCPDAGGVLLGGDGSLDALDVRFSVAGGPVAVAGATGALAVLAVCWLVLRFGGTTRRPRIVAWWAVAGIALIGLIAAAASGGAAVAGGVLLVLPVAVAGALPVGLGVPLTVRADGVLACALDGAEPIAPTGALMGVSGAALLVLGIIVPARLTGGDPGDGRPAMRRALPRTAGVVMRLGLVVGAGLAGLALLGRVDVDLGAFGGTVPLLDARLGADPLLALGTGLAAGAAAGLAGIMIVQVFRRLASVSWRPWKDRARP